MLDIVVGAAMKHICYTSHVDVRHFFINQVEGTTRLSKNDYPFWADARYGFTPGVDGKTLAEMADAGVTEENEGLILKKDFLDITKNCCFQQVLLMLS